MNIKRHIPNLITLANLFCGCVALVYVSEKQFEMAFYMVCLGIFFDFFDGFFARMLNVSSPLGLQLDSLADMVTSGVVPGMVVFKLLQEAKFNMAFDNLLPYFGFVITLGSCYRLANFNIDTRQTDSFIGLPTPANALFFLSLPLVSTFEFITEPIFLIALSFLSAFILNAEIPLFSLKFKKMEFSALKLPVGFMLFSIITIVLLKFLAIPIIILTYILVSIIKNFVSKKE